MRIQPISSRVIQPPHDTLDELWAAIALQLTERSVVVVTSKVVAIAEGRCVLIGSQAKDNLIKQEADQWLPRNHVPGGWVMHAIKDGILAGSCGIDESNANGYYILWPSDPTVAAQQIWQKLHVLSQTKEFGVIVTDSHSVPMRRGVTGFALGFWGLAPLVDYRGQVDLFGRELRVSQSNVPDALAAAATLMMGEGSEGQPAALISELPPSIRFLDGTGEKGSDSTLIVPLEEDLYQPFIASVPWEDGGKGQQS